MRYLAKLSVYGPKADPDYWHLWEATEHWLAAIGKVPSERGLTVSAHSLAHLRDWATRTGARVDRLEGWLPPSPVDESRRYLETFYGGSLGEVRVPFGEDSWVRYVPGAVVRVKAAAGSWIAPFMADATTEFRGRELAWTEHGRVQRARQGPRGFVVVRYPRSGWREWVVRADPGHEPMLAEIWAMLAGRLGTRPLKVVGHGAVLPRTARVAGLAVRLDDARLTLPLVEGEGVAELCCLNRRGVRLEAWWQFPCWTPTMALSLKLTTRQTRYPRLEGLFDLTGRDGRGERELRREARRLPILDLRPLPFWEAVEGGHYADVERWAKWHQDAQDLIDACRGFAATAHSGGSRRLPRGWTFSRLESGRGRWVVRHEDAPITVEVLWPRAVHPGHLAVHMGGVVELGLDVLDPSGLVDRWHRDWRYWQATMASLLARVAEWVAAQDP